MSRRRLIAFTVLFNTGHVVGFITGAADISWLAGAGLIVPFALAAFFVAQLLHEHDEIEVGR